jgi:hypothetical protein
MRALPSLLRKQLETSVLAARRAAEAASRAAIDSLGVFADRRPEHLDSAQAALRNGLRAKWRQLGNDRDLLVAECAYEQWHRLLFARFLAENGLLLHPQFRAPVTLAECEELATDLGEPDAWSVAARFAAEILPGIFRLDDPCVRLRLAPEGRHALEQILDAIPAETVIADDALGWVYQFWQKDKKDEVNASERKIGGADLGPVTQLFTENYMVRFLLENSLGAWWAARHLDSPLVKGFEYLRFGDDGKPAAGTFEGWPDRAAEITVMDPCCGSGHFLVEAFSMLWQMRAEEEGLAPVEAQDAVLHDNLFGLELDSRCVQIAMFNVALQAWKVGHGWRQLPTPNIACSGIPVKAPVEEWKALADGDQRLENALVRLHILFHDADTLGSLIDPKRATEISDPTGLQASLEDVDWEQTAPLLEAAVANEDVDPATVVLGNEATTIARAAGLLARRYTLVATNVPYLSQTRFTPVLRDFIQQFHAPAKADIGTAFLHRFRRLTVPRGAYASVSLMNWLFLSSFKVFRTGLLRDQRICILSPLGPGAFDAISGEVVKVVLSVIENGLSSPSDRLVGTSSVGVGPNAAAKAQCLRTCMLLASTVTAQLSNPDARITLEILGSGPLLSEYAESSQGICTGDYPRFGRYFWEVEAGTGSPWAFQQSTPECPGLTWSGCQNVLYWENGKGDLFSFISDRLGRGRESAWIRGTDFVGGTGVTITQAGSLQAGLYSGELFDNNTVVLIARKPEDGPALVHFVLSPEFVDSVRLIDSNVRVADKTMLKVPFDVERWRNVAEAAGPLSEPWSDDPTQWLFEGRPEVSTVPLQVAVGRLVGYRWPEQPESDDLDVLADADGIVCLPAVAGEPPAADRVQQLLAAAFGESWTPAKVKELLEQTGSKKNNLADWLRDEFFKQHCSLFGNRPFVWHIWDGQRDGFSALVNYHRLDRKTLEKLTYTYLGQDWMERQRAEVRDGVAGAEARLAAALGLQKRLQAILEGEAPLDIYVRWKEIHEQPIGWEPDLNDGVRLNIRPFVEAGVLRSPFNIHWRKDRGKNPDGTERLNDVHLTSAEKIETRKRVGRA